MLSITFESLVILTKDPLEEVRSNNSLLSFPHLVQKLGPSQHDPTFSSKWVLVLSLYHRFVSFVQIVLGQFPGVGDALDTAIHIACVSEVAEAHLSFSRVLIDLIVIMLLQLSICLGRALIAVEPLVPLHASLIAVLDIFALAY